MGFVANRFLCPNHRENVFAEVASMTEWSVTGSLNSGCLLGVDWKTFMKLPLRQSDATLAKLRARNMFRDG